MRSRSLALAWLFSLIAVGCAGVKVDTTSTATEVARIQAEAMRLGAEGAAKTALDRSHTVSQRAAAWDSQGKSATALAEYQGARAAAVAALFRISAQRSGVAAETCRRELADARRAWEDALYQLEQTERVSGRKARGVERSPLAELSEETLPRAVPTPPDSVSAEILEQAARNWKSAAERLRLPTSDLESSWTTALLAAGDPKAKLEIAQAQLEIAAWHIAQLEARVWKEAQQSLCAEARLLTDGYMERRDGILLSLVDMERGLKESARAELARLEERQKSLFDSLKQLKAQFATISREARGTIRSLSELQFEFDKAVLRREAEINLAKVAVILAQYPEMRIQVEGHTDNIGKEDYNQKLSERRAAAVHDFLVEQNISASRMSTAGFGMTQPVASNATEEGRQKNRRVDLVISENQ